jgi:SAM-dependent methyltransferase
MTSTDVLFTGSIPAVYDRHLVPMLFDPYARDLVQRLEGIAPSDILEIAAGTGVVTTYLAETFPDARIVATDLNQAMLDVAADRIRAPNVRFEVADAEDLPFTPAGFDAVVCQFGVMFFPDRLAAYRGVRRVLRPGGTFLFNAWDRIEANPGSDVLVQAVAGEFPDDPEAFFRRVPFGYHDVAVIEADLDAAGFETIEIETVEQIGRAPSARDAATGLCQGTPLRSEIEAQGGAEALERATAAAAAALARLEGPDGFQAPMSAHVARAIA